MKPRPVRVACIGHASLDHVFGIAQFPSRPSKTPAHHYVAQGGGMSFNAAIAAARLGASVRLIGRVGHDAAAAFLRDALAREGIDAQGLLSVPGCETSVSAIVVDESGERQIVTHRGSALHAAPALDVRWLEGADIVLTDPRWPAGARSALQWARQHGVMSMLDADVAPRRDLRALVPLADWAVFSEAGWAAWGGGEVQAELPRLCRRGGAAVVTQGEHGAWFCRGGEVLHVAAFAVAASDTTAAGDVFHAALAVALAEGHGDEAALRLASAAAAMKCERGHGAFGAPTRAALLRWLTRQPR